MATLIELARLNTDFDAPPVDHLQRLVRSWGMLADLCFGDLVLFAPVKQTDATQFVVLGQIRPTTSQTLHRQDLVGSIVNKDDRPLVFSAWDLGEIVEGEFSPGGRGEQARSQCIPVRFQGRLVGIVARESPMRIGRRPGELERVYVETFDRFTRMIANGEFPFANDDSASSPTPSVGDGTMLLDASGRVTYASPNAINALHRVGVHSNAEGATLAELNVDDAAVRTAFTSASPVTEEIESRADVIVLLRCIPLIDKGQVSGALVLMRDVSDLRRRDRLLISKDATIREVHHRVKNNLQTISSLLRLQARRMGGGEGRTALEEAERRIRSIAVVHEVLSRDVGQQVEFNEIVEPLIRMAEEGAASPEHPVRIRLVGDAGDLSAEIVTPLAVVLTELLINAVEHAFAKEPGNNNEVTVTLDNDGTNLRLQVRDNGGGFPPDFSIDRTSSLGLSIVRDLVTSQLSGSIDIGNDDGAVVELTVPVRQFDRSL